MVRVDDRSTSISSRRSYEQILDTYKLIEFLVGIGLKANSTSWGSNVRDSSGRILDRILQDCPEGKKVGYSNQLSNLYLDLFLPTQRLT